MKPLAEFDTNDFLLSLGRNADGSERWVRDVDPILDAETVEKIRQGYICIECFQHFESAFPETCPFPTCGFPVRAEQSLLFLKRFKGIDPTLDWQPSEPDPEETAARLRSRGVYVP